jgi:hypothetical protein
MVSHEQHPVASRTVIGAALALALLAAPAFTQNSGNKFYPDDPLLREPPPRPVKDVAARHTDDIYDFLDNSFAAPRRIATKMRRGPHPALDVNTLGDVPDSTWYTNRHFYHRMSIEDLQRGPGNSSPPSEKGMWRIIAAKSNGITPGFAIEDELKNRYLLKFDQPEYPELASAADVIGSKFFYALGYNTPENYIVHFRREQLQVPEGVMWRDPDGKKRPLTDGVIDELLKAQPKLQDGSYRALASRWIEGDLAGPFSYAGMRTDDPNDIIPHEDRRVLRGLRVSASWLNHQDTRSINSMDSLVNENGVRYLKHFLMDFGSILGSDGASPKPPWSGNQYAIEYKSTAFQMLTFGFFVPRWERSHYPRLTGVGLFDSWSFDPVAWKPNYPNPAFMMMDREDAFWAAKQVAAFTDAEIRALVETGEYSDPRAAQWIADCLIKRRDKIADAWFSRVLPLDHFRITDGRLEFEDLQTRGDRTDPEYSVSWTSWDGDGWSAPLPDASTRVPGFRTDTQYLSATIRAVGSAESEQLVRVYVRPGQNGPEVVGIRRS